MELRQEENFFEIKVSPIGMQRLAQMFKAVKWAFAFCITMNVLFVALTVLRMVYYSKLELSFLGKIESIVTPIYAVLNIACIMAQWISFFYFGRSCKKSIVENNSEAFNYSFKWLQRFAAFAVATMVTQVLIAGFYVWEMVYLFSKMPTS